MGLRTADYTHSLNDCSRNRPARVTSFPLGRKCRLGNPGHQLHVTHSNMKTVYFLGYFHQSGRKKYGVTIKSSPYNNWPGFKTTTGWPHSGGVRTYMSPGPMCCRRLIVIVWFCVFVLEGSWQEVNPIVPLFTTRKEASVIFVLLGGTPTSFKCQTLVVIYTKVQIRKPGRGKTSAAGSPHEREEIIFDNST